MNAKTELIPTDSPASTENTFDPIAHVSRRAFMTTAALAGAGVATLTATAQTREELLAGRQGD
ncbi:twin-arginine translocation signal domain-containing protein [Tunturibacter psychrotolerans]|uniref:Twin-arginine translocation signal domain-containing protein n=1 Tax=Tunturiibacter psychrotolerans TaxID=3069686 RepID=A0AAU7ZQ02_9BACT